MPKERGFACTYADVVEGEELCWRGLRERFPRGLQGLSSSEKTAMGCRFMAVPKAALTCAGHCGLAAAGGGAGSVPRVAVAAVAGTLELTQRALEILDLLLVGGLLPLGVLHRLQHFFHLVERRLEGLNDVIDLLDGGGDGSGFGGAKVARRLRPWRGLRMAVVTLLANRGPRRFLGSRHCGSRLGYRLGLIDRGFGGDGRFRGGLGHSIRCSRFLASGGSLGIARTGTTSPAPATAASAPSSATARRRSCRLFRRRTSSVRLLIGKHRCPNLPRTQANAKENVPSWKGAG